MLYEITKNFDGPSGPLKVGQVVNLSDEQFPSGRLGRLLEQRYLRLASEKPATASESRGGKRDGK